MIRMVNEIYVTECITFPRCGHTWLSRILKYYFKKDLNYCEMYNNPELMIDVNENTNLQKNHDFNLNTQIKADRKYLVQIRNREDCLNSFFNLEVLSIDKNYTNENNTVKSPYKNFSDYGKYINWIEEKKYFYNNFLNKWVFNYIPNCKIVIYEHLKNNTYDEVHSILQHMTDKSMNEENLIDAIKYSNIPHNKNEPFRESYI